MRKLLFINGEPSRPDTIRMLSPDKLLLIAREIEQGKYYVPLNVRSALADQLLSDATDVATKAIGFGVVE